MSFDPLVLSRVVGDVIDDFDRRIPLRVMYNGRSVLNGVGMKPSIINDKPRVEIGGVPRMFYTLVMVDPDAPNPSNPSLKEYLHWMLVDIPANMDGSFGTELMEYVSPQPTSGIHRIVFVLYQQLCKESVFAPDVRHNFDTRKFAREHYLGPPVAALYFNCQRENGSGGRRFRSEN
uniref:FT4 n=2 Tax=Allium cepa TaxID=4679 RepID=U5U6J3_ALLCE|nr:FT4 [Allium cepa]